MKIIIDVSDPLCHKIGIRTHFGTLWAAGVHYPTPTVPSKVIINPGFYVDGFNPTDAAELVTEPSCEQK